MFTICDGCKRGEDCMLVTGSWLCEHCEYAYAAMTYRPDHDDSGCEYCCDGACHGECQNPIVEVDQ